MNEAISNRPKYPKKREEGEKESTIEIDGSSFCSAVQGELQDLDVPLHDHLLPRGWFQAGVAASNRVRDYQVRQVRQRRSPGRGDRIREVINYLTDR